MELISYEEFSRLNLNAFFMPTEIRNIGPSVECALGFGGGQSYGSTALFWPDDFPGLVGELQLDMRIGECPLPIASKILLAIQLPLLPGDSQEKILIALGQPEYRENEFGDEIFYRFIVGKQYPYVVGCHFSKSDELNGLMVVRRDMWFEAL